MKKQEQGQVLPLGLVLIVACMTGALVLFNTSTVATDKMRLANSADAAAYSGALWQARALNYQAYANRAMVANQVAIAQAISINSWMNYAAFVSSNVTTMLMFIPIPGIANIATGIQKGVTAADQAIDGLTTALLETSDSVNSALSLSQDAMFVATFASAWEVVDVVARETDSRFTTYSAYGTLAKVRNSDQWNSFNSRYAASDSARMQERGNIINESRDDFTRARDWDFASFWIPVPAINRNLKLRRQGATELVSVDTATGQEWEWVAKDTMSLHTKKIFYGFFGGSDRTEIPLAWASTFANSRNRNSYISPQCGAFTVLMPSGDNCMNLTRNNHAAEKNAARGITSLVGRSPLQDIRGYGGVRDYWGLSDSAREQEDARMTVMVEVTLPIEDVLESDTVLPSNKLNAPVAAAGSVLSSLSSADVFYRRPNHHSLASSERERANEYNPYWQAQLSPVEVVDRYSSYALRPDSLQSMTRDGEFAERASPSVLQHLYSSDASSVDSGGLLLQYSE